MLSPSIRRTLYRMGEMKRANAREAEERQRDRFASTLVIAAAIIAAVRLARDDISRPSPRLLPPSLATYLPPSTIVGVLVLGRKTECGFRPKFSL